MPLNIGGVDLGINLPNFSTSGIGFWVTIVLVALLLIIIIAVLVWYYLQKKAYNIQIRDFENISGKGFQLVAKNTAKLIKIGDGGEEVLYLRKGKTFRTAYGKKMGKNEYWFCKGQDGYWYNVTLGDLDAKMGMLDIEPIDRDMRYMHVAIRKNIQDRYKKKEGLEKYIPLILSFIFLIVMVVAVWLLISKAGDLIKEAEALIKAGQPVADSLTNALSKIDTICGSSGIK